MIIIITIGKTGIALLFEEIRVSEHAGVIVHLISTSQNYTSTETSRCVLPSSRPPTDQPQHTCPLPVSISKLFNKSASYPVVRPHEAQGAIHKALDDPLAPSVSRRLSHSKELSISSQDDGGAFDFGNKRGDVRGFDKECEALGQQQQQAVGVERWWGRDTYTLKSSRL